MVRKKFLCLAGVFIAGCAVMCAAFVAGKLRPEMEWDGTRYRLEDVNALDARFARPYDKTLDDLGTLLVLATNAAAYGMAVVLVALGVRDRRRAMRIILADSLSYLECGLYTCGLYKILKLCAVRVRPYMYFPAPSAKGIAEGDFCLSWPSGHSSVAFIAAAFMLGWFSIRFPLSRLRKPAVYVLFLLGLSTMALRMLSGNHFLTDVLSGAALGFITSTIVFRMSGRIWGMEGAAPGSAA